MNAVEIEPAESDLEETSTYIVAASAIILTFLTGTALSSAGDLFAQSLKLLICKNYLQHDTNALHMQHKQLTLVATNTATPNLHINPFLEETLRKAALQEHRSIANVVVVMFIEYC